MRIALSVLLTAALVGGCGNESSTTTDDESTTVRGTVNVDGDGGGLSPEARAALAKRLAGMKDLQNRKPGMPNMDAPGGNPRVDTEAIRRIMNSQAGGISDDEIKKAIAITRALRREPSKILEHYRKHSMTALRYATISSLFARHILNEAAPASAKPLSDANQAVIAKWAEQWKAAAKGE